MNVARDVVVCAKPGTGEARYCTDFLVQFKPVSSFYKWLVRKSTERWRIVNVSSTTTSTTLSPSSSVSRATDEQHGLPKPGPANNFTSVLLSSLGFSGSSPKQGEKQRVTEEEEGVRQDDDFPREGVEVFVNKELIPDLEMFLDEKGYCVFANTLSTQPLPEALNKLPLKEGENEVQYVYRNPFGDVTVTASMHLWHPEDKVIVSDIDGTISKSDVAGIIHTVTVGNYSYTHRGICELFSHLAQMHGIRFIYLTSRPISLLTNTRQYLHNVEQNSCKLPPGPIFTSTESLPRVLYKELVSKTVRYFKANTLNQIANVFYKAGRDVTVSGNVFFFGFGNKKADGSAYHSIGIPRENIFLINPSSDIRSFEHLHPTPPASPSSPGQPPLQQQQLNEEEEGRTCTPPPPLYTEEEERVPQTTYLSYADDRLLEVIEKRLIECHLATDHDSAASLVRRGILSTKEHG